MHRVSAVNTRCARDAAVAGHAGTENVYNFMLLLTCAEEAQPADWKQHTETALRDSGGIDGSTNKTQTHADALATLLPCCLADRGRADYSFASVFALSSFAV